MTYCLSLPLLNNDWLLINFHVCSVAIAQESSLSITSIPKLHELNRIERNGKVVRVIECVASSWDQVAVRLHFEHYDINRISRDTRDQSVQATSAVFTEWLEGKGRRPTTWETLIAALREGEYLTIAKDLEVIFGVHDCSSIVVSNDVNMLQPRWQNFKCTVL